MKTEKCYASEETVQRRTRVHVDTDLGPGRVVMENGLVRLAIIPSSGGKIASIENLKTGREFLLQPRRAYRQPSYGSDFSQFDRSGFDECFPTVAPCSYPGPKEQIQLPDHGEVWSAQWKYEVRDDELILATEGVQLPYQFQKRISISGSRVAIAYELRNLGSSVLNYLWSAHPLLAVEKDVRIVLPAEVKKLFVNSSEDLRLGGHGDVCDWPLARTCCGASVALDKIETIEARTADKLFTSQITNGNCGVFFPSTNEALVFRFDARKIPFVGLWICQGAWPTKEEGDFTVALEPCNGRPDSLEEAISRGENASLQGLGQTQWELAIDLLSGSEARSTLDKS